MAWDDGLTGEVLAIARTNDSPLRVVAGPGTGKSFAMQRRVARLIEEGSDPKSILAVTFTRNAANSLRDDLRELGIPGCDEIWAGTLHSFCFRILAQNHVWAILGRVPRPLMTFNTSGVAQFECRPLLADLSRQGKFGNKREMTERIRAFEGAWARLQHEQPGWPDDPVDLEFSNRLREWLEFHRGMLIGELVPEALRYIKTNPADTKVISYDHIIVDEYQDLNKAEQVVLDKLSERGQLAIVGDPDQSIYGFRYAHPEGILEFSDTHTTTHDELLNECRRCPRLVVRLADYLIRHNDDSPTGPHLTPLTANHEGEVEIVQWNSISEEAEGLARYVKHLIDNRGYEPGDILILSPRRKLGYGVRDALAQSTVPVHSFFSEEPLEESTEQEAFTLLSLLANPEDRVSLRYWLGVGSGTYNAAEYERMRNYCESANCSPTEALAGLISGEVHIRGSTKNIQERFRLLQHHLSSLEENTLEVVVDDLFPADAEWASALRQLAERILPEVSGIEELAGEIRNRIAQPEMPEEADYVRIMSLHKAKGLTAKVSVVVGCMEGIIPTLRDDLSPDAHHQHLREQRRLFYVAMTRCRQVLVLSSIAHLPTKDAYSMGARVPSYGPVTKTIGSRFLNEIGPDAPPCNDGRAFLQELGLL